MKIYVNICILYKGSFKSKHKFKKKNPGKNIKNLIKIFHLGRRCGGSVRMKRQHQNSIIIKADTARASRGCRKKFNIFRCAKKA